MPCLEQCCHSTVGNFAGKFTDGKQLYSLYSYSMTEEKWTTIQMLFLNISRKTK